MATNNDNTTRATVHVLDPDRGDDMPPLIPEGRYSTKMEYWRTSHKWGRQPKVDVVLTVIDGPYMGTNLVRHYNATRLIGKPQRSGKFAASFHGDLLREFVIVTGKRPPRLDRIPMTELGKHVLIADVRTVGTYRSERGKTAEDLKRPEALHYSIVHRILRAEI